MASYQVFREEREKYMDGLNEKAETGGAELMKYLFLINGGGAVAILAYLGGFGRDDQFPPKEWLEWFAVLQWFVGGVVFVGLGRFVQYHLFSYVKKWAPLDLVEINFGPKTQEKYLSNGRRVVTVLCYCAFACFIWGAIQGGSLYKQAAVGSGKSVEAPDTSSGSGTSGPPSKKKVEVVKPK